MIKKITLALFITLLFVSAAFAQSYVIKPSGFMNKDLVNLLYDEQTNIETRCHNSGALATATASVSIAAAINYTKDGVFGQIATGTITPTGDTQAVSVTKLYCFSYNATTSTTEITVGAAGETDIKNIVFPDGNIPFGYMKMVTDSTHTYVPGTTTIGSAGCTGTYYNLAVKPSKTRVQLTSY